MPEGLKGTGIVEIPLRHGQVMSADRPELISIHLHTSLNNSYHPSVLRALEPLVLMD